MNARILITFFALSLLKSSSSVPLTSHKEVLQLSEDEMNNSLASGESFLSNDLSNSLEDINNPIQNQIEILFNKMSDLHQEKRYIKTASKNNKKKLPNIRLG